MTPTREQVIEWARASGAIEMRENALNTEHFPWGCEMEIDNLLSFAALAYSAGRLKGLDEAAAIAPDIAHAAREKWSHEETWKQPYAGNRLVHVGWDIAAAIAQLKEQTP